jgi:hypothetical protein
MSKYTLRLNSLTCHSTSDPDGGDEVWFLYQADGGVPVRYPYGAVKTNSMDPNDVWSFGTDAWPPIELSFEHDVQITLWEQDLRLDISLTDFLGNLDITPASADGNSPDLTNGDSSRYTFNWTKLGWGT